MQYVQEYMRRDPEDKVTIIGGAAAYFHLRKCNIDIPVKDIDVNITSVADGRKVLDRWLEIVPPSYVEEFDVNYPISIFTLTDTSGKELSIDVFINEEYISETEEIELFQVEKLERMINRYYQEITGRKKDIELIQSGVIDWNPDEIPIMIDKYNRLVERFRLLAECLRSRYSRK